METYAAARHVPIIRAEERDILLRLVDNCKPHAVLEIGTAIGYSALLIASCAAPHVQVTTLELDADRAAVADAFIRRSSFHEQIHIHVGDAAVLLPRLTGTYDFVFIDAAKGQYVDYFHKVLPLLAKNAVIAADNVLFRGYVRCDEKPPRRYKTIVKRLREYITLVNSTPGFVTEIHEDGDGLAISRRLNYVEKT